MGQSSIKDYVERLNSVADRGRALRSLARLLDVRMPTVARQRHIEVFASTLAQASQRDVCGVTEMLRGRYAKFVEQLSGSLSADGVIDNIAYYFRFGNGCVDHPEFSRHLLTTTMGGFSSALVRKRPRLAQFVVGSIFVLDHQRVSDPLTRTERLKEAVLTLTHLSQGGGWLSNRAYAFLSQVYVQAGDATSAIDYWARAVMTPPCLPNLYSRVLSILTRPLGLELAFAPSQVASMFCESNLRNRHFWSMLSELWTNAETRTLTSKFIAALETQSAFRDVPMSVLDAPLLSALRCQQDLSIALQELDFSKALKLVAVLIESHGLSPTGVARVLGLKAQLIEKSHGEAAKRSTALTLATTSLRKNWDPAVAKVLGDLLVDADPSEFRECLDRQRDTGGPCVSLVGPAGDYCRCYDDNDGIWNDFRSKLWVSGRWAEEIPVLEAISAHTRNQELRDLCALRLASLFSGGQSSPLDHRHALDYKKALLLLDSIPSKSSVASEAKKEKTGLLKRTFVKDMVERVERWQDVDFVFLEKPRCRDLLVVFSCVATHARFAGIGLFGQDLGRNVLFVNNSELNWYSGASESRLKCFFEDWVFSRFERERIAFYFGSMGGYAAIKFGTMYGIRAIAFNPQINLDSYSRYRGPLRAHVSQLPQKTNLDELAPSAYESCPLYLAVGQNVIDVEAFDDITGVLQRGRCCNLIVEKYDDDTHAGLFPRVYDRAVPTVTYRIADSLAQLSSLGPAPRELQPIASSRASEFWDVLRQERQAKGIVIVRDGQVFAARYDKSWVDEKNMLKHARSWWD